MFVVVVVVVVFCLFVFVVPTSCTVMWLSSGKPQKERYLQANEEFQNRQGEDPKGLINADSILSLKY